MVWPGKRLSGISYYAPYLRRRLDLMKKWLAAARLRTLPLAFSSIILGSCLAAAEGHFSWMIFILCLLTTLCYQILSNYANDLGDGLKGTDDHREGEARAVASGAISAAQMKKAVWLFAILSFFFGTVLSLLATASLPWIVSLTFVVLGLLAIGAAITYTMGRRAYGYSGWGDVSVLLFFGYVGVVGSYFLQSNMLNWQIFLPATSVGFLAMGVLNLNNMRDLENDRRNAKHTLAVRLGLKGAKIYQTILIVLAFDLAFLFNRLNAGSFWQNLYFLSLPLLLLNLFASLKARSAADFEPLLKMLAIATLIFALTFGAGHII